ncbi:MAG: hypothetical protein JSV51_02095 [Candidatus Bathyarchaeota archaeon]|nr:MAG: hypothetical protein JSV51_02095 [Candidatus Bathyarchaeota archaeon]
MSKIKEEIRRRVPRLTMSLVMAIIFLIISSVVSQTSELPLLETEIISDVLNVASVIQTITIVITAMFLIRALFDALVLGDIVTDIIVRRLGIKEERSPKRAARDLIYIIVIILITTAIAPIIRALEANVGYWLSMFTIYAALGLIIILIYDIGRILYRIIEQRAEILADRLSKIAEQQSRNG